MRDIKVLFQIGGARKIAAVNGVSLEVERGESVGIVGESGCGKSTLANAVLGLVPVSAGSITFDERNLPPRTRSEQLAFRRRLQMIFQDPHGSLNPRLSISSTLEEVLKVHHIGARLERRRRAGDLLETVGLERGFAERYPHEFSGGQRQRIGIARALAVNPSFIIADEPVSALDVSVQVQILNLMKDLQERRGLSYLFIAHDLAVVRYMCSRIYVMYAGRIMESGRSEDIFTSPSHPYTEALLAAVPDIEKALLARARNRKMMLVKGEPPSGTEPLSGCPFHPRCPRAEEICRREEPVERQAGPLHMSACHFARLSRQRESIDKNNHDF